MAARLELDRNFNFDAAIDRARTIEPDIFDQNGEAHPAFEDFLSQAARYRLDEEGEIADPEGLVRRVCEGWTFLKARQKGADNIRVRHVDAGDWRNARLVLEIATEDRPFLVDSISAALAERGKDISYFLNAVLDIARADDGRVAGADGDLMREATLRIEMDPTAEPGEAEEIEREIRLVLADVRAAVDDWEDMRARLASAIAQLERARLEGVSREKRRDSVEFLKWMWDNKFAFLGVRRFDYKAGPEGVSFTHATKFDRGLLRDAERRILGGTFRPDGSLAPEVEAFLNSEETVLIAKANARSLVHRRTAMDYIGVKLYAADGRLLGEERFVGLFTAQTYNRPASDIPLVRNKVSAVLENAGFAPGGHNENALVNILETYPRDELLQIDERTLTTIALGVLQLNKRPHTRLFVRRDRFNRFVSALAFVPRDRFNSTVRQRICKLLAKSFDGSLSSFTVFFGEGALARIHIIVDRLGEAISSPNVAALEREVEEIVRTWSDDFIAKAREVYEGAPPKGLVSRFEQAFPAGYRDRNAPDQALLDIAKIETLGGDRDRALRAFRLRDDAPERIRLKLYQTGSPLPLSDFLPTLENMGLRLIIEAGFPVTPTGAGETIWIHEFVADARSGRAIDFDAARTPFEETCEAVLANRADDDDFNALVLASGVHWREAAILRACAKFQIQSGFQFSLDYMAATLIKHADITALLIKMFEARFDPSAVVADREARVAELRTALNEGAEQISSIDEDRILRRFANLIAAIKRTNFYQKEETGAAKAHISFKIASRELDELPEPRPFREIFVSSPQVEGVHLRFGAVARGGLRWSDRKEDYRTEVLDLVKAQQVKNAVIVPVGSKGGFYPRQLPVGGDRDAVFQAGREAYKTFIRGLLDVTDNIVEGAVAHPDRTVLHDEDDPYLVVAADKGTATFSDTANAIAVERGFWLGDAFASGGSAGYDHKQMGITARGAWEAVKRHFREMGVDIQNEEFTAAGVGDMSGDVFGNGMLLSKKTRLIAAFDHRDIFIDPDPDAATTWEERKRLFDVGRSSWQDYDKSKISTGGGIFSRGQKSIPLTDEIRALLDIDKQALAPNDLIQAILKMRVDLMWMGGIGTYYKATYQDNWRVGDRANDTVRANAADCRAKVIGEGANLGLTQEARIEFAANGGRINTDAIDNSAGVDSSDHEVNIKILLARAIERGELATDDRNDLLRSMTDDVAEYVLVHNYDQTRAISMMERTAPADLDSHGRFMGALERAGRLDRALERLPGAEEITERKLRGEGLTRPELSVLTAYSKIWLFDELLASDLIDDDYFLGEIETYFPTPLRRFQDAIAEHRLRREIIATRLSNEIVNTCGLTFAYRATEATGASYCEIAAAYEVARRVFMLSDFAAELDDLDNEIDADVQLALYLEASDLLRKQVYRIARLGAPVGAGEISTKVATYKDGLIDLIARTPELLNGNGKRQFKARVERFVGAGLPQALAERAAATPFVVAGFDILDIAQSTGLPAATVGALYHQMEATVDLDDLREFAAQSSLAEHFDRLALRRVLEDFAEMQHRLTLSAVDACLASDETPPENPGEAAAGMIDVWRRKNQAALERWGRMIADLDIASGATIGKMALAARRLEELCDKTEAVNRANR
ncbi:MAG: NAD-glutamate dehydrogenase [Pseudomonadota bacterium]